MEQDHTKEKSTYHHFWGLKATRLAAGSQPGQTPALSQTDPPSSTLMGAQAQGKKAKYYLSTRFLHLRGSRRRGEAADPGSLDTPAHDGNVTAPKDDREDEHDANAHHQQNLPNESPTETGKPPDQTEANPWDQAYSTLSEKNKDLVEAFEKILTHESSPTKRNEVIPWDTPNQFQDLTGAERTAKMKEILEPVLSKAEKREFWEELAVSAVEFTDKIKDHVKSAVEVCTPAAAAWAGICLLLPVIINPVKEDLKMAEGLRYVMDQMNWYLSLTNVVLRQKWTGDAALQEHQGQAKEQAATLFTCLLKFEMECACRAYVTHPVVRVLKDMVLADDWGQKLTDIQALEQKFAPRVQQYVTNTMVEYQRQTAYGINSVANGINSMEVILGRLRDDMAQAAEKTENSEVGKRNKDAQQLVSKFGSTTYVDQLNFNPKRQEGTCKWFERHHLYTSWVKASENKLLLVTAEPGCGKSVLARFLIEDGLRAHCPDALILYFFFKDNTDQNDLAKALKAILHQCFESCPDVMLTVDDKVRTMSKETLKDCSKLWGLFEEICQTLQQKIVFCVLDALDECQAQGRGTLITFLESHFSKSGSVRFLVTSRPYSFIVQRFRKFSANVVSLEGDGKEEKDALQTEIEIVFNWKINELVRVKKLQGQPAELLRERLKDKGKGQKTYLWAELVFKLLEGKSPPNTHAWLKLVDDLPTGVPEAYERLLSKVSDDDYDNVRTLLHIVFISMQPLSLTAANTAVFIQGRYSLKSLDDLGLDDESFGAWVKDTCGFFITEYDDRLFFIHQTAKDFLSARNLTKRDAKPGRGKQPAASQQVTRRPQKKVRQWKSSIRGETEAHFFMSESCLASLNQALEIGGEAAAGRPAANPALLSLREQLGQRLARQTEFFIYSSNWWLHHFAKAQISALNTQAHGVDASSGEEAARHYKLLKACHALIACQSTRSSLPDFELASRSALNIVRDFTTAQLPLGVEITDLMDQCLAWCSRDFPRPSFRCSSIVYATTFNIPGVLDIALAEGLNRWPETSDKERCDHSFETERFLGFFIAVARKASECARLFVEFEERLGVDVQAKFKLLILTAQKLKGGCSEDILQLLSRHPEALARAGF